MGVGVVGIGDPRTGLLAITGGIGLLTAVFMAMVIGFSALPMVLTAMSLLLLFNLRGGPLRQPLAIINALVLGILTFPLLLNGTGAVTLIGCIAGVAAIFYHPPTAEAALPGWLETRRIRHRRARRSAAAEVAGDAAPEVGAPTAEAPK